jgi:hypothetical protein
MICLENEFDVKMKWQTEKDNDNNENEKEEKKEEEPEGLKKRKLITKKFEVTKGSECEDDDEESDDEEENNYKPIIHCKTGYNYCNNKGLLIDDDEVYIDENEIDTTGEFHYQIGEKCTMEIRG